VDAFSLTTNLQKDYLDLKVDMKEMERTLQKFKNQINLQCNIHPLIDENSQLLNPNDEHV